MYEKHNWVNGEVITEDKLNHLEDGVATGGGIYTFREVSLFDSEVTTSKPVDSMPYAYAEITPQGQLPESDIHVTFNGQDYTLPHYSVAEGDYWGELDSNNMPSFTNYPLYISSGLGKRSVMTPEVGTYALKIIGNGFELNNVFKNSFGFTKNLFVNVIPGEISGNYTLDKTYSEINSAILNGDNVRFLLHGGAVPTKEYYFDSILYQGGSNWTLYLFSIAANIGDVTFNSLEFSYTNSEGYPCNYDSSSPNA